MEVEPGPGQPLVGTISKWEGLSGKIWVHILVFKIHLHSNNAVVYFDDMFRGAGGECWGSKDPATGTLQQRWPIQPVGWHIGKGPGIGIGSNGSEPRLL